MEDWDPDGIAAAFTRAALDPDRWAETMDTVARSTGGVGALMFSTRQRAPIEIASAALGEASEAYVRDGWVARDERYRGVPFLLANKAFGDLQIATPEEIAHHPYYQDFLARFGLRWSAVVGLRSEDDLWSLSIQRRIDQAPFSPEELDRLAELSRGLSSAVAVARALGFARAEAALAAFEASRTAALLLDRAGEVVGLNGRAEALLDRDVRITRHRVTSSSPTAGRQLDRALNALLREEGSGAVPAVALPRPGRRPVVACPMRLPRLGANPFAPARAVLVLVDLEPRIPQVASTLRSCFGLTAAEASLAVLLGGGESLESAAEQRSMTRETARSHLKSIFAKTGVHRQAELVALLLRMLDPPA